MTNTIEAIHMATLDGVADGIHAQVSKPAAHVARAAKTPRIVLSSGAIKVPLEIVDYEAPFVMP